jgi:hypothetical protein
MNTNDHKFDAIVIGSGSWFNDVGRAGDDRCPATSLEGDEYHVTGYPV